MRVHIRAAKGDLDRFVPLPESTLLILRQFWKTHRHPEFIFPSRKHGDQNMNRASKPLSAGGAQQAIRAAVKQLGFKKTLPLTACVTVTQPI